MDIFERERQRERERDKGSWRGVMIMGLMWKLWELFDVAAKI
jgi:hypothetical protein